MCNQCHNHSRESSSALDLWCLTTLAARWEERLWPNRCTAGSSEQCTLVPFMTCSARFCFSAPPVAFSQSFILFRQPFFFLNQSLLFCSCRPVHQFFAYVFSLDGKSGMPSGNRDGKHHFIKLHFRGPIFWFSHVESSMTIPITSMGSILNPPVLGETLGETSKVMSAKNGKKQLIGFQEITKIRSEIFHYNPIITLGTWASATEAIGKGFPQIETVL